MLTRTLTLVAASAATGLTAGLLYGYAISVMPGLARTDDRTFVTAMRAINEAILNGWFALGFVGSLVATPLALALHLTESSSIRLWVTVALLLQVVVVVTTGRGNVPLNRELAERAGEAPPTGDDVARAAFETRWNRWHRLRTLASVAAFGCLLAAVALH